jgi:hypothetical protein
MATFWALPISMGFSESTVSEIVCVSFIRYKRINVAKSFDPWKEKNLYISISGRWKH